MRRLLLLPLLLAAPGLEAQAPAKTVSELKAFFVANCVKCHGADGSARSAAGEKLRGQDFTSAEWQAKTTEPAMAKTMRKGIMFGMVMPSFKDQLTEADAALLAREVLRKAEKGKAIAPEP